MRTPNPLEISEWGRYIVWCAESSWYDGKATNSCTFSNCEAAIEWAKFEARGQMDWSNFPDPAKKYPYDDRDGSNPDLTPVFVATWQGGSVRVTRTEVCDKFDWAAKNAPRS